MKQIYNIPDYYIDKAGDVFSNIIMPNSTKRRNFTKIKRWLRNGYWCVSLSSSGKNKNYYIHNLLLETFICPRPEGYQCRHRDGNRLNIALKNLSWGTVKENQTDRLYHGTDNRGIHHPLSKYSDQFVSSIKKLYKTRKQKEIAEIFGVPKSTISFLLNKRLKTPCYIPPPKKSEEG